MSPDRADTISLRLKNVSTGALTVVIEPWASQYKVEPGHELEIVEKGGEPREQIEIHLEGGSLTFFARTGSVMSAWRDGHELP